MSDKPNFFFHLPSTKIKIEGGDEKERCEAYIYEHACMGHIIDDVFNPFYYWAVNCYLAA